MVPGLHSVCAFLISMPCRSQRASQPTPPRDRPDVSSSAHPCLQTIQMPEHASRLPRWRPGDAGTRAAGMCLRLAGHHPARFPHMLPRYSYKLFSLQKRCRVSPRLPRITQLSAGPPQLVCVVRLVTCIMQPRYRQSPLHISLLLVTRSKAPMAKRLLAPGVHRQVYHPHSWSV